MNETPLPVKLPRHHVPPLLLLLPRRLRHHQLLLLLRRWPEAEGTEAALGSETAVDDVVVGAAAGAGVVAVADAVVVVVVGVWAFLASAMRVVVSMVVVWEGRMPGAGKEPIFFSTLLYPKNRQQQ